VLEEDAGLFIAKPNYRLHRRTPGG
jgi:hypothetical protein